MTQLRSAAKPETTETGAAASDDRSEHGHQFGFRRLLKMASGTALLQATSNAAGFLTALLLARFLGKDDYGRYAFSFAWASLLALVATLGVDRFLVRGIAVYEVEGKWPLMKGLLRRSNQVVLLTSVTIAAAGCLVAVAWLSASLRGPFCVAMLLVPLTALTLLRQGAMQAFGRVVSGQIPEFLIRPLLIVVGVCLLELAGGSVLSATTALGVNVAAVATAFTVGTIWLIRALPPGLRSVTPLYATWEWIRASVPMMVITGVWLLNSYIGIIVAGTLKGPGAAGVYSVVQNGAAVIVVFLVAANMPLAPAVARLHARKDAAELERTTERIAWAGLLVSMPVCIALALFPGLFLGLFGASFKSGSTALTIVALGQLANAAAGPSGTVLIMTGHEIAAVKAVGTGALVNLALAIALVPIVGVTGSAIAFTASLVFWNLALVLIARRRLGVNVTAFRRLSIAGER